MISRSVSYNITMKDLSIIIVSFNTKKTTATTLDAVQVSLSKTPLISYQLIVIDNGSTDGSVEMLKAYKPFLPSGEILCIFNKRNIGFGAANNQGIKKALCTYILLLNSDVVADNVDFSNLLNYMGKNPRIGILTVRVMLGKDRIDPASHRGFPTVWRSFCYFSKLQALTHHIPGLNHIFGGYHLMHKNLSRVHEIDAPTAAFFLTRKDILDKVRGFDESYFMYGEDLDLAFRIKQLGYSVVYYPLYSVLHLKHQSGLKHKSKKTKRTTTYHFYNAMKIFYDTHYAKHYPWLINACVHKVIDVKYWFASL